VERLAAPGVGLGGRLRVDLGGGRRPSRDFHLEDLLGVDHRRSHDGPFLGVPRGELIPELHANIVEDRDAPDGGHVGEVGML